MSRYLRGKGESKKWVGHNPAGALMVLLLLGLVLAQAVTGLFANDQITNAGPLSGYVSSGTSDVLTGIHRWLANIILICVCVHVGAVFGYLLVKREDLIRPMLTGKKQASVVPLHLAIATSRTWLAVAIAALVICALLALLYAAPKTSLGF